VSAIGALVMLVLFASVAVSSPSLMADRTIPRFRRSSTDPPTLKRSCSSSQRVGAGCSDEPEPQPHADRGYGARAYQPRGVSAGGEPQKRLGMRLSMDREPLWHPFLFFRGTPRPTVSHGTLAERSPGCEPFVFVVGREDAFDDRDWIRTVCTLMVIRWRGNAISSEKKTRRRFPGEQVGWKTLGRRTMNLLRTGSYLLSMSDRWVRWSFQFIGRSRRARSRRDW
jgi:hypothetical protein